MQLIELDAFNAERSPTGVARGCKVARAAIGHPVAAGPGQPSFRRHDDLGPIAAPRRECTGNQAFVVADVRSVNGVSVGRVEEAKAGVERGVDDAHRLVVVAIGLRRETHAADAAQPPRPGQ